MLSAVRQSGNWLAEFCRLPASLLRSFALIGIIVPAALGMGLDRSHAQNPINSSLARPGGGFNHAAVGFPLTGAHQQAQCESCHVAGRFRDTPRECSSCHNGAVTAGMSMNHPRVTEKCEGCHQTTGWTDLRLIDHTQIRTDCGTCHNNVMVKGKPLTHMLTSAACETCHKTTASFAMATKYVHQPSDTNCATCHNGTTATGLKTPPHIPVAAVQCSNCHVNTAPSFATYTMNHASVSASRCDSCHNSPYAGEGKAGALATSAYPNHVATAGRDCLTCHVSAAANFTSWAGGEYTHRASDTNCSSCHNGTAATGLTTPPHIPITGVQCSNCHVTTATSFVTYTMNHASASASRCDSCHNGAFTSQGTKGATGTSAYPGHVATAGRDCVTCHAGAATAFTSWAGGLYTHQATDTNCSSCHNGTTATGHTTPPHVPVAGIQCGNCHVNTATSFATYTMNHASVSASRCDSCHNGAYTGQGTKGAVGTASYAGHVASNGSDCATCHASAATGFTSWAGGKYTHQATNTNCANCHNGTTATGHTTPPHVPVAGVQCSNCHINTATSFATYTMNHASVSASRCDACHNGSFTSQGTKGATGTASYPNHPAAGGKDCLTCHATAATAFASWTGGIYVHQATDTNCSNCHNGTTALGLNTPPHIPTAVVQCGNCHVNTAASFVTYTMNHASVSASRCDSCHNGAFTAQGTKGALGTASYANHPATGGNDCLTCHATAATTFSSWAGGKYVHQATDTNCSNCHNGTTALGLAAPPHVPVTGVQCSNCHVNTAASFVTYTMNHASVSASRCDSCHNGSFTSEGTKGAFGTASYANHPLTGGRDCMTCHASAAAGFTSWSGGKYAHAATDTNCASCHNGTAATGLTTPPHLPVAGVQCGNCHVNTAVSFVTYTMNHASVNASRCDSCHSGGYTSEGTKGALGTSSYAGHVATGGRDCATCHTTAVGGGFVTFKGAIYVHQATDTNCSSCHNGTTATGHTTPPHVPVTGVQCGNCHVNTATSFVTYTMNHASVSASRCDSCHNGTYSSQGTKGAVGTASYPNHVATDGIDCVTCHASAAASFTSWSGGKYTHQATDTKCSNCHNGATATGLATPPHVPVTGVQCGNCHVNTAASFVTYTMNHASVSAGRCDSCHNGTYTSQGTKGAFGTASYPNHVATNGTDCVTCHASAAASFVAWTGGKYTHAATDTNCSSCHNGAIATGLTTPPHVPVMGVQCSNCHVNTAASFTAYTMNHASVSASRCDSCHNGNYASQGTKGAYGTASYANHPATNGGDCLTCHAAAATTFTSWVGGTYVHQVTDTNCSSCHNGTNALGLTMPPHIPTATVQCSNCHVNTAASFTTYTMNHAAVSASRCDACHNGTYTAQGTKGALGTAAYANHPLTGGRDCMSCHASAASSFTNWSGGLYVHAATDTNCSNCHNGTTASGMVMPPHIPTTTVQCSNCHVNTAASFTTYTMNHGSVTANRCDSCHSGSYTSQGTKGALGTASYAGHIATSGQDCAVCHAKAASGGYVSFAGATYVHQATDTNCSTCHNGTTATGHTTPPHVPVTGIQCGNCHVNTATSFATYTMNHASVSASRCDSCHNGTYTSQGTKGALATASYPNHVATNGTDCVTCHASAAASFTTWSGGKYTHQATDTNCSSCHNGATATGLTTPPHVPVTGVQCSNCHVNTAASFTTYTMNHTAVSASRCESCHNGSYSTEGSKGAMGTASFANHVPSNGLDCLSCHASAAASFTSWSGGKYTHAATDTICSNCHNGTTATGMTTPPHVPATGVQCSNCHVKTAASFTTYMMNHPSVSASRCDSCHNGSYATEGSKGALGTAAFANHVATAGRDCVTCHASAAASFTSWAGGLYTHAATDTNCSSCHNGTTATGMTTPPHVPTAAVQCSNCHVNTATSFTTYTMNHASVSASRCDSCHNGSYASQGTVGAQGTASYPNHVATNGTDCVTCHVNAAASFTSWAGGKYTHQATDTNCSSCHNGTTATGMTTPPHVPVTGVQCSNCHVNTATSFTTYTMTHSAVIASRCDSCHNGSYTSQGTKGALGTAAYSGHVATNGQDCAVCHAKAVSGGYVSFAGATYVHQATDTNCSSCHNGTTATGNTSPPHIPLTAIQCGNCHVNTATSFTTYTMNHTSVSASRCDACHNGSFTSQGTKGALGTASYSGHIATAGRDCVTCHATAATGFTSWGGGTYTHAATDTNCSSCHNGTSATGMTTPPHIPTTTIQCSNCHVNTATSFTTYTMTHSAVTASRCDSCHNGSYTSQGTKGALGTASYTNHVATNGNDCITCHATAQSDGYVSWSGGQYSHSATDTNCSSCHNGTMATGMTAPPHIPTAAIQCSNCHINTATSFATYTMSHSAVTASRCDSCHNGAYTSQGTKGTLGTASYTNHVATNGNDCITCHATAQSGGYVSWSGGKFTHAATDTNCTSCHNGTTATGMTTPPHIPTTTIQCSNCHVNMATSFTTYTMTHSVVATSRCDACHNGSYTSQGTKGALGTSSYANHVATNGNDCITCHATAQSGGYVSWSGGKFTHSAADTNCTSCHNGTTATGMTTPPHIPTTTIQCGNCHVNTATSFTTYTMIHSAVTASRCDACHNGSYTSQGTKGALGTASYSGHVATNGTDCVTCHATGQSGGYVSWAGGIFTHSATDTNCSSCHNGTTATGDTTPPHIPASGIQCSNCHVNTATSFTTYTMNHTAVTANRCDSCHDGSYTSQGTKGAYGTSSYAGHVATNGNDCVTCHATAKSGGYASWSGGVFTHAATDTNCSSCHNGTTATGETTPPHIPITGIQCGNCHSNTAAAFTAYTMSHAAVHATRCDTCHSGAYKSQGTKGASGPDHGAKSVDCGCCHVQSTQTFSSWSNPQSAVAGCVTTAKSLTPKSLAVAVKSLTPNTTTKATPIMTREMMPGAAASPRTGLGTVGIGRGVGLTNAASAGAAPALNGTFNHAAARGPCATCHNGKDATGRSANHLATTAPCETCHKSTTTFAGAKFIHTGISTDCATCHNGVQALGKPLKHLATNAPCESCHKSTATFAGARFAHTGISSGCAMCHNGRDAMGKPAKHVVTSAACETCHKSTKTFIGAQFSHAGVTAPCASCHNGVQALGKPANHVATTAVCDSCHKSTTTFSGAQFSHTGVTAPCATCHNGIQALGKPVKHVMTNAACDSCHRSTVTFSIARFNHAVVTAPCASCHNGRDAPGKPQRHVVTNAACDDCHKSTITFSTVIPNATSKIK